MAVVGTFLLAADGRAQDRPWYEGAEGIEAGLFGGLHEGDVGSFRALLVTGVATLDAPAAEGSFEKAREWLASRKIDLSKSRLLKAGQSGIDLSADHPARSLRMVWDLKHRDTRFFVGCAVTFLTDGRPDTARIAGPVRCWLPAQGVKVTAGKGETLGSHEVHRYVVEGQSPGEVAFVLRKNGEAVRASLPVPRGSWKVALSLVECPGKGPLSGLAPTYDLTVADRNSSSSTLVDVTPPEHTEIDVKSAFTEGLAGPLDFLPLLRRSYSKLPEGARAGPEHLVYTLEIGVEFKPE